MELPTVVRHSELMEALEPLANLLGVHPMAFYATPGITIAESGISFTVPVRFAETPVGGRPRSTPAVRGEEIPPHPQGIDADPVVIGEDEQARELGYEVRIPIDVWMDA